MDENPLSPPVEPAIPLDSHLRSAPIHELLPEIRVPNEPLPKYRYNPVTCTPIKTDDADVQAQLEQLRKEFPSPEDALKEQKLVAQEVKQRLQEAEKKREDVQKAMDKKLKERNTEMKVLSKYQEGKTTSSLPS